MIKPDTTEMIPSAILLYASVSALSSYQQKAFLQQLMGVSAETHSQTVSREGV